MPKDDRDILHAIRFPVEKEGRKKSQIFTSGMEDELAAAATPEQLGAWLEAGHVTGTWKGAKASGEAAEEAPKAGTKTAKK